MGYVGGLIVITGSLNESETSRKERDLKMNALALKVEEGTMSQGMLVAARSWKSQETSSPASRRN